MYNNDLHSADTLKNDGTVSTLSALAHLAHQCLHASGSASKVRVSALFKLLIILTKQVNSADSADTFCDITGENIKTFLQHGIREGVG